MPKAKSMKIYISRIDTSLPLPKYHTDGAVAFDLYSRKNTEIAPGEVEYLPTNVIIKVPEGHTLILAPRSSLHKHGLMLANHIGVIDQDYHGEDDEIKVALYNFIGKPASIKKEQRIAQGLIMPIAQAEWEEVEVIKQESRSGFGSTGK